MQSQLTSQKQKLFVPLLSTTLHRNQQARMAFCIFGSRFYIHTFWLLLSIAVPNIMSSELASQSCRNDSENRLTSASNFFNYGAHLHALTCRVKNHCKAIECNLFEVSFKSCTTSTNRSEYFKKTLSLSEAEKITIYTALSFVFIVSAAVAVRRLVCIRSKVTISQGLQKVRSAEVGRPWIVSATHLGRPQLVRQGTAVRSLRNLLPPEP